MLICQAITQRRTRCTNKATCEESYCNQHQKMYPRRIDHDCSICTEYVRRPQKLENCGHIFCFDCVNKWIAIHDSCPMCRSKISLEQLKDAHIYGVTMGILTKVDHVEIQFRGLTSLESDILQSLPESNVEWFSSSRWVQFRSSIINEPILLQLFMHKSRVRYEQVFLPISDYDSGRIYSIFIE